MNCGEASARRATAAQQQGLRIRRQGADRQGHRAPGGLDHQGHMHRQELPHFVGTRLVDAKTHQHPADDHRRAHGHHHKLVRHAVHHRNLAALRLLREAGHHLLQRGGKLFHAIGQADGAQCQVGAQQGRHGRADAAAVVLQHRLDGVLVPGIDRRAEAVVGRQQRRALAQALGVLLQQAAPDVLVQVQRARDLGARIATYASLMEAMEVRKAAAELRAIWVIGNEYLQAAAPWSAVKTDPARAEAIVRLSLNLIRVYAILSRPFIPDASATMMAAMGSTDWSWPDDVPAAMRALPAGAPFSVPENLFRKITDEERADWQARFAGIRT